MATGTCAKCGHEFEPWHNNASTKCSKLVDKDKETPAGVFNTLAQCDCKQFQAR